MLVALHGLGSNERDLFELAKQVAPGALVISLRAPLELGPDQFSWFPVRFTETGPVHDAAAAERSRLQLVAFLRELRSEPGVDPTRVTLLGFSQGAMMSEAVALTAPELVSGVVLIGGRTLPELKAAPSPTRPRALVLHGTRDARLPYENAVRTHEVLRGAGYDVDFRPFDAGHEINAEMVSAMRAWLR